MSNIFHDPAIQRLVWTVAVAAAMLPLSGCGSATGSDTEQRITFDDWMPGKPLESERERPYAYQLNPETIFATSCSGCHGDDGRLGPAPPLNDSLFLAIYKPEQMLEILAGGRSDGLMPAFDAGHVGGLTEQQRQVLVTSIWKRWGGTTDLPANIPPYMQQSTGDATAGKAIFAAACSRCHGDSGSGGSAGALNTRGFLALVSDQLLRRIMITGRPDLGCPDFVQSGTESALKRPLSSNDIANVVALMGAWRTQEEKALLGGPQDE